MGFTPSEVNKMSLWEYMAVLEGHRVANGGAKKAEEISDDELSRLGIEGF